jgi:CDP-paratose 2-epimerase
MAYLITGGCGFLGSNLAAELIGRGQKVVVFDNLSRHGSTSNLEWLRGLGEFEFIHGDVRNTHDVDEAVRGAEIDVIYHVAGQVAMTTSMQNPRKDFEINVGGSINVLEAVRQGNPKAVVIYSSSNKVYGALDDLDLQEKPTRYSPARGSGGIDESAALEFHTPYGCSKGAADQYMLDYARGFNLKTVVFRHSTIYGGRQHATFDQGWVGWFCRQALEIKRQPERPLFTICGDGKQVRDLLHVSDAVRCYLTAAELADNTAGNAFNIGGGVENSLSLLELFAMLEKKVGVNMKFRRLPWRASDQKYFVADNAKAKRVFDWSPRVGSADGVADTLQWEASRQDQ